MAKKPKKTKFTVDGKPLYDVPYGAYDPALDAQLRASQRGLDDLRDDTKTAGHWAKRDLKTDLFNINRDWKRTRQTAKRDFGRNKQKIRFQRKDLRRDYGRARQDFRTQLQGIGRQFSQLAESQREGQNAAGTLLGGTAQAAAAKRAENRAWAEQPIHTAQERSTEDFTTSLGRLAVARKQLGQDFRTGMRRGRQDVRQSRRLTKRSYGRGVFDRDRKLQRGIREQKIGEADILQQKIHSARQLNPGSFTKYGRKKK